MRDSLYELNLITKLLHLKCCSGSSHVECEAMWTSMAGLYYPPASALPTLALAPFSLYLHLDKFPEVFRIAEVLLHIYAFAPAACKDPSFVWLAEITFRTPSLLPNLGGSPILWAPIASHLNPYLDVMCVLLTSISLF